MRALIVGCGSIGRRHLSNLRCLAGRAQAAAGLREAAAALEIALAVRAAGPGRPLRIPEEQRHG